MAIGKNIKGITIEFNGDTTKLGKALTEIDGKTRGLDKSLREVDNALKFNPKNTELLAQKQQLLGQKVDQTKERLNALKEAQAKLDDDPAVDKTSQDYMELRREIITTESKLSHFEDELKKVGNAKLDQLGAQFKNVGEKMQKVGEGMSKYVTAPIVGGAAASIAAFKEVDDGLDIVAEKTGASGDALDSMKESAKSLAQEIPTDFETAGTAIGEVNTRFGITGDALEKLSGQFIKFAQLNDVDVNSAIDKTQKALSAFGLSAEDAGGLLDSLNVVGQNTGASMDSLLDGLIQNGTAFQELGLSAEQAANLMGQMETSGANSETVMQGLRKALKSATEQGIPLNQALSDLQNTILHGKNGVDGLTAAYDLFGKSGDQIYGAVKNGTLDFSALGEAALNAGGSVEDTFNNTLDPADKFQTTLNSLKIVGYEIANSILPLIAPVLERIAEKIQALSEKWTSLSPTAQKTIITVAGLLAAIGPLLILIGKIATGIQAIIAIAPMLGTAFTVLTGPVGLIVAAIAAAIAIGVALYKNWDKIKAAAGKLKDWVSKKFSAMKKSVVDIVKKMKDGISGAFKKIGPAIKSIVKGWFSIITWPYRKAWEKIKDIVDKIKDVFDFEFEVPDIPLPHFSIDPPGWQIGDLLHGVIPGLNIDWYAKGGIFNSPTIAGLGDVRGGEAAVPLDPFWEKMDKIVDAVEAGSNSGGDNISINVYAQPGMDVNQLAAAVEQRLVRLQKQREVAHA